MTRARARREIALLLLGMQAAVLGQSPAPTRYAPNGHTLDAADFLSELGERSLRCSACELVAERMDYMIPLLVRTWPTRSSAERAKMLRAMLVQRGCKQIDAMHVSGSAMSASCTPPSSASASALACWSDSAYTADPSQLAGARHC